jgi:hypothetical protein
MDCSVGNGLDRKLRGDYKTAGHLLSIEPELENGRLREKVVEYLEG